MNAKEKAFLRIRTVYGRCLSKTFKKRPPLEIDCDEKYFTIKFPCLSLATLAILAILRIPSFRFLVRKLYSSVEDEIYRHESLSILIGRLWKSFYSFGLFRKKAKKNIQQHQNLSRNTSVVGNNSSHSSDYVDGISKLPRPRVHYGSFYLRLGAVRKYTSTLTIVQLGNK